MKRAARLLLLVASVALLVSGCALTGRSDDFVEVPGLGQTRIDVPRPEGSSAPCDLSAPVTGSVEERIAGLRAAGLFADRARDTDASIAADVEAAIRAWYGDDALPTEGFLDLFLSEQDPRRVWWMDLEADVGPGGDVYVATLEEWAAISEGAFAPTGIVEDWASDEGPVTLTFTLDGAEHTLEPAYLEDWIDPTILAPINALIAPSGRAFTLVQAFDQSAYLLALTPTERAALEGRGWCFE